LLRFLRHCVKRANADFLAKRKKYREKYDGKLSDAFTTEYISYRDVTGVNQYEKTRIFMYPLFFNAIGKK
jgi:hypothetical protein